MFALGLSVAIETRRAETAGTMSDDSAHCVLAANVRFQTGDDAAAVLTALIRSAIFVSFAFVLLTLNGRISTKTGRAEADGQVI